MLPQLLLTSLHAVAGLLPAEGEDPWVESVREVLSEEPDASRAAEGLADLGAPVLATLHRTLALGWPAVSASETAPFAPQELDEILLGAFAEFPLPQVRSHLRLTLEGDPALPHRIATLRVLGHVGRSQDLDLFLRAADLGDGNPMEDPLCLPVFQSGLEGLLQRDVYTAETLASRFDELHPAYWTSVFSALAKHPSAEGLVALERILQWCPEATTLATRAVSEVAGALPGPFDPFLQERTRLLLDSLDPATVHAAVLACGALQDHEALPRLFELMEEGPPYLRAAAGNALRRVTGLALRDEPDRWRAWYLRESEWWENERAACLDDLASADPGRVSEAIRLLTSGRLYRDQRAEILCDRVSYLEQENLLVQVTSSLAALGSARAIPTLEQLTDHEVEGVARSAQRALASLRKHAPEVPTGT